MADDKTKEAPIAVNDSDDEGIARGLPKIELVPVRWDVCETDEPGTHGIPRDWREDMFGQTLDAIGINIYGYRDEEDGRDTAWLAKYEVDGDCGDGLPPHYEIRTPLFVIRPFYWGDDDEVYRLPNFEWLPWHLEVSWYKWPLRDARSNLSLTDDDWRDMCSQMLAWAKAEQAEDEFAMPEEQDRRSEADIWAKEWSERLHKANDQTDRHWCSITGLLDALSVPELDDEEEPDATEMAATLQGAIDVAVADSEWGVFLDEVEKRLEVVGAEIVGSDDDGNGIMTLTIKTIRPEADDEED